MREVNELIICSTPYQVFTAINLRLSGALGSNCDLVVFDYFNGSEKLCEQISKENLFSNVKSGKAKKAFTRCTKDRYSGFLWNSYYNLRGKSYLKYLAFDKSYARIYYSFADPSIVAICNYLDKHYKGIEFIGFEDGLSNYYNRQSDYLQRNLMKVFGISKKIYSRDLVYMYCPELAPDPEGKYIIKKIQCDIQNKDNKSLINRVFSWEAKCQINSETLYFDQLPHYRVGATDDFNIKVAELLTKYLPEKCMVKKHPRRTDDIYSKMNIPTYEYSSIPFEVCTMNSCVDDMLFVTNISSACFMPKMIFNLEPRIVFLFNIEHKKEDQAVMDFLNRFVNSYKEPQRIQFPNDWEELENVLKGVALHYGN